MAKDLKEKGLKVKKKKWVMITAPALFSEEPVGETYVVDSNSCLGKVVEANLMNITGNIKHQPIILKFKVTAVNADRATTEFLRFEVNPSAIRRMIRRDLNRLDSSFVCETLDKKLLRIKVMAITRNKTKSSVLKVVRKTLIDEVIRQTNSMNLDDLLTAVLSNKLQVDVKQLIQKIYPLRTIEVRYVGLTQRGKLLKAGEKQEVAVEEEPIEEAASEEQSAQETTY